MGEVRCPKCNSFDCVKKGKTKDKQFQRLQCKSCKKGFQVETSIVNRQTNSPHEELRIVKHPDGAFSINTVRFVDAGRKDKIAENKEYIVSKVSTYKDIVSFTKGFAQSVNPHEIMLNRLLTDSLIHEIELIFQPNISQHIINLLENMARGLKWGDNV